MKCSHCLLILLVLLLGVLMMNFIMQKCPITSLAGLWHNNALLKENPTLHDDLSTNSDILKASSDADKLFKEETMRRESILHVQSSYQIFGKTAAYYRDEYSFKSHTKIKGKSIQESLRTNKWNDSYNQVPFQSGKQDYSAEIHVSEVVAPLNHFWESTGFCPPDPHHKACEWFMSDDMWHNLVYIGSVPYRGIKNVRIHYLLDAVYVSRVDGGTPVYDFTCLDQFIQRLYENGLRPGFELMGNPSNFFTDLENKTQVYLWRDLVHQLANRYIDEYGLGYVSQWNFESWNEPKPRTFDGLHFTFQGFLNYYDACSEGLRLASELLILGAPSGGCKDDYSLKNYCWVLLNHIDHGVNYFTGKRKTRVDYLSVHKKGNGPNNSDVIMHKESMFQGQLHQNIPGLLKIPIVNDEADPLVTWSKPLSWRADSTYAGMVAKVIHQHQEVYFTRNKTKTTFRMLSNDNSFLSYQPLPFNQRTLLARFQANNTQPPHTQYIRKPAHSVMGLLALLGDLEVKTLSQTKGYEGAVGVLASIHKAQEGDLQDSWRMTALVYYSVDTMTSENATKKGFPAIMNLNLTLAQLKQQDGMKLLVYVLDDLHGNPWKVWLSARSPATPSHKVLDAMRAKQDPVRVAGPMDVEVSSQGTLTVKQALTLPGVALVHVCAKPLKPPDQVSEVTVYNITCNQVLISWSDSCVNSRCILRYNVEYSSSGHEGSFTKINPEDSTFTVFVYAPRLLGFTDCSAVHGYYRVQAVDYWLRHGEHSLVVHY